MNCLKLSDICTIKTGRLDANAATENGKYPFFTCAKKPLNIDTYAFDCECVLLAGNGEFNVNLYNGKFNAYQRTYIIEVKNKQLFSTKFIYYIIMKNADYFSQISNGGIIKFIKLGDIQSINVPNIPLFEQEKIVAELELINDRKELLNKEICLLDELKTTKFIKMFGHPLSNEKSLKISKLKDLASKITNGTTPKGGREVYSETGITFLRSQNVWNGKIKLDDVAYIDEGIHNSMKESELKKFDILITKTGRYNTENSSLGRSAIFMGEDGTANINGHVYLVRLKLDRINPVFLLTILHSQQYHDYIRKVCVGGTDKRQLNKNHIEDFPIILPSIDNQKIFADIANKIDILIEEIENQIKFVSELMNKRLQFYFA